MLDLKNAAPKALAVAIVCCLSQAHAAPGDAIGAPYRIDASIGATHALPSIGMAHPGTHTFLQAVDRGTDVELLASRRYPIMTGAENEISVATGPLTMPSIAQSRYGISFATWVDTAADGSGDGIFGRFISTGGGMGPIQPINTTTTGQQAWPTVATDSYGARYAVAFTSQEGDGYGVRLRDYRSQDGAIGPDRRIDAFGADYPFRADVAMNRFGHAAVAWSGRTTTATYAHQALVQVEFDGTTIGPRTIVSNGATNVSVNSVAVARDLSNEGFVAAWSQNRTVYARRLDEFGAPRGDAFVVYVDEAQMPGTVDLGVAGDGSVTVAWTAHVSGATHLYVRHFDATGTARGDRMRLGDPATTPTLWDGVGVDGDGDTVVSWTEQSASGAMATYAQRFEGFGSIDLSLVAQPVPTEAEPGQWLTWVYDIGNPSTDQPYPGEQAVTGLTLSWPIPAGVTIESAGGTEWTCTIGASIDCAYGALLHAGVTAPSLSITAIASTPDTVIDTVATIDAHQADPNPDNDWTRTLTTVVAADDVPDAFDFADRTGVALGSAQVSAPITVAGINRASAISVVGGSYSVNGGAYTTAAGLVAAGDSVRVQHTAAATPATEVTTTLSIGGVSGAFTTRTVEVDTTPDAFAFVDRTGVATGTAITSAPITVAGVNQPAAIVVTGGAYSVNGGAFTTAAGSVSAGDSIRVQHVSSSSSNTAVNTTLTIGGVADTFTSTTGSVDTTPSAFAFTDVTGARRGRSVDSNVITITGYNAAVPITVSGSGASYSKNGGAFTSAPGTLSPGNTLRLRVTASSTANTRVDVQVSVGGVSDTWSVTSGTK